MGYSLIAVASGSRFCNANNNGNANYNDASNRNSNGGIRPLLWNCRNSGMRKYSAGNETASLPLWANRSRDGSSQGC